MNEEEEVFECADCGTSIPNSEQNHENDDGERVCEECAENYVACQGCGETVSRDSELRDESGYPICESCAEHYFTCAHCARILHSDQGFWIPGIDVLVCNSCLDDRYSRCEDCGRYASEDDSYSPASGGRLCQK